MPRIAKKYDNISIVIPCAGQSDKIKNHSLPKCLINVSEDRSILQRQIDIYKKVYPNADVVVVGGYGIESIVGHIPRYVRIVENPYFETTGVLRSIALGLMVCNTKSVMITYGDLVFNKETVKGMFTDQSRLITRSIKDTNKYNECGINKGDDGIVNFLAYGLPQNWCQIIYLTGRELDRFRKECYGELGKNRLVSEAINGVISRGGNIYAHSPTKMKLVDVDSTKDLVEAKKLDYECRV